MNNAVGGDFSENNCENFLTPKSSSISWDNSECDFHSDTSVTNCQARGFMVNAPHSPLPELNLLSQELAGVHFGQHANIGNLSVSSTQIPTAPTSTDYHKSNANMQSRPDLTLSLDHQKHDIPFPSLGQHLLYQPMSDTTLWENIMPRSDISSHQDDFASLLAGNTDSSMYRDLLSLNKDVRTHIKEDFTYPLDSSKLTYAEREKLIHHLQCMQLGEQGKSSGNSLFHRGRLASEESLSVTTSNSLSGEELVLPPGRHRSQRTAYVWNGELPPRNYVHPVFSCKIFVGGVPWDISEEALIEAFCPYGDCRVEWPGKEPRYSRSQMRESPRGKVTGYVYMIFELEKSVKALLQDCSQEFGSAGEWYFKLKARRNQTTEIRQVQVIPWVVSDASYVGDPGCRLDAKKTVFVGALHGMITAHVLFSIMEELYGNVVFVGIDTDKYKYPIGSGRVTFRSHSSYFRAIESAFLEIKTSKFGKKVQIDPFLEDVCCMMCEDVPGPYFCRDRACFRYFCQPCWQIRHGSSSGHRPLMRNAPRIPTVHEEADLTLHHRFGAQGHGGSSGQFYGNKYTPGSKTNYQGSRFGNQYSHGAPGQAYSGFGSQGGFRGGFCGSGSTGGYQHRNRNF